MPSGTFAARLHGPGQPDAGVAVEAQFIGNRLRAGPAPPVEVPATRLTVDAGGFNQDDVVLAWDDAAGGWCLMVSDEAAKRAMLAQAPPALSKALQRWNRGVATTRNLWRGIFATAAVSGLALGLGVWQYDRVIAWTAAQISPDTERRLGQRAMDGIRASGNLVEQSPALDAIRDIGGKLTRASTRQYEWYLKDDPSLNAFALPGGFVVVHTGLVHAVDTADELAGVLAHETQHIEQRHTLQNLLYQLGWATVLTVVLGDPSALTAILLLQAGNLKFNRELETQADLGGVEALRQARIPPEGFARFFRHLEGKSAEAPAWLSTHPATSERMTAIEQLILESPCAECRPLAYHWAEVRESLYRDGLMRRPAKNVTTGP